MSGPRDEFLSEEDLDLRNLSEDELVAYWNLWLEQAQATNDLDAHSYSHGVFEREPEEPARRGAVAGDGGCADPFSVDRRSDLDG
jgi:hypothetical protein